MTKRAARTTTGAVKTRAGRRKARTPRMTRADRRRSLLDAAGRIVAADGPAALTMERLAEEAGVTKPVAYLHFENRASVLLALMDEGATALDDALAAAFAARDTIETRMQAAAAAYFDVIGTSPLLPSLLGERSGDEVVERRRLERRREMIARWGAYFGREASLDEPVADAALAVLIAGAEGAARYWLEHPDARPLLEDLITRSTVLLIEDLGRLPPEQRG